MTKKAQSKKAELKAHEAMLRELRDNKQCFRCKKHHDWEAEKGSYCDSCIEEMHRLNPF